MADENVNANNNEELGVNVPLEVTVEGMDKASREINEFTKLVDRVEQALKDLNYTVSKTDVESVLKQYTDADLATIADHFDTFNEKLRNVGGNGADKNIQTYKKSVQDAIQLLQQLHFPVDTDAAILRFHGLSNDVSKTADSVGKLTEAGKAASQAFQPKTLSEWTDRFKGLVGEISPSQLRNLQSTLTTHAGMTGEWASDFYKELDKSIDSCTTVKDILRTIKDVSSHIRDNIAEASMKAIVAGDAAHKALVEDSRNNGNPDTMAAFEKFQERLGITSTKHGEEAARNFEQGFSAEMSSGGGGGNNVPPINEDAAVKKSSDAGKKAAKSYTQEFADELGSEAVSTDIGQAIDKSLRAAEKKAKRTLSGISYGNYTNYLSDEGQSRWRGIRHDKGEELVDTSAITQIGKALNDEFETISAETTAFVDKISHQLGELASQIPESVTRTVNGNIVNTVAIDARSAYKEVASLIDELKQLPNALSTSPELQSLYKGVEKYKKAWQDARDKRDAFVINTNNSSVEQWHRLRQQIEEQLEIKKQAEAAMENIVKKLEGTNVSPIQTKQYQEYKAKADAAAKSVETLEKKQQSLANNRAIAGIKMTYETYTTKMYDANKKLTDTLAAIDKLKTDGGASNANEIIERREELIKRLGDAYKKLETAVQDANTEAGYLNSVAPDLTERMRDIVAPKGYHKTAAFKELEAHYRAAYKELQTLSAKQDKYIQNGTNVDSKAWKNLALDIEAANRKLDEYEILVRKATQSGEAFTRNKRWFQFKFSDIAPDANSFGSVLYESALKGLHNAGGVLRAEFKGVWSILKGLWGLIPKIGSGLSNWVKHHKSLNDSAKELYRTFTRYFSMLRTRIRRKFVSMVFEDLQNNIKRLAALSPRLNIAISGFVVSVRTLGAQIVAAFEPLVSKVLPYITLFVDYLTEAAANMASLISELFGDTQYIAATKGTYDFAASMDSATNSTKKATKAAKDYESTVMSFDELHKLNGDNGTENEVVNLNFDDLEKKQNRFSEIMRKIRDAFNARDWRGFGSGIAAAVNEGFSWLSDTFGWTQNAEKFTNAVTGITAAINGFIQGLAPIKNGEAIADVINSVINIADQLLDPQVGIHFEDAGKSLGDTFTTALLDIDWSTLGQTLMHGLQGAMNFTKGFLTSEVAVNRDENTNEIRRVAVDDKGVKRFLEGYDEEGNAKLGAIVDEKQYELMTGSRALARGLRIMFENAIKEFNSDDVAELIIALVDSFFTLIGELFSKPQDAADLGHKIGETIAEAFKGIDKQNLATGINNFTNSFVSFFDALIDELVGAGIGDELTETLKLIDWLPLFKVVGMALAPAAITGLITAIGSTVKTIGEAAITAQILGALGFGGAAETGAGAAAEAGAAAGGATTTAGSVLSTIGQLLLGIYGILAVANTIYGLLTVRLPAIKESNQQVAQVWNDMGGWEGFGQQFDEVYAGHPWEAYKDVGRMAMLFLDDVGDSIFASIFHSSDPEWLDTKFEENNKQWTTFAQRQSEAMTEKQNAIRSVASKTPTGNVFTDAYNKTLSTAQEWLVRGQAQPATTTVNALTTFFGKDGEAVLSDYTANLTSLLTSKEGTLPTADAEQFKQGIIDGVVEGFKEALANADGDIVLNVGNDELARATILGVQKLNKQGYQTALAFSG